MLLQEKISISLIESNQGIIIASGRKAAPFDLKFIFGNIEYWMEIKSILEQNSSNLATISKNKLNAEMNGKKFILGVYYSTSSAAREEYILCGDEYWEFIGGKESQKIVSNSFKKMADHFSIKNIVSNKTEDLYNEFMNKS